MRNPFLVINILMMHISVKTISQNPDAYSIAMMTMNFAMASMNQSAKHGRTSDQPEKLAGKESGNGFSFVVWPRSRGNNIVLEKKRKLEYDIRH